MSLSEKRVTISSDSARGSENDLKMCSFHKEVANHLISITSIESDQAADTTNLDIVNSLAEYTQKAIDQAKTLGAQGIADIKNAATSQWMSRLAAAEGI